MTQAKNTSKPNLENLNHPNRKVKATGPTWRMPHAMKTLLWSETNAHSRGHFKRMMVEANAYANEMAIQLAKKKDKKNALIE